MLKNVCRQEKAAPAELYVKNGIPEQYRDPAAVNGLYACFASDRCASLKEAYTLYKTEKQRKGDTGDLLGRELKKENDAREQILYEIDTLKMRKDMAERCTALPAFFSRVEALCTKAKTNT